VPTRPIDLTIRNRIPAKTENCNRNRLARMVAAEVRSANGVSCNLPDPVFMSPCAQQTFSYSLRAPNPLAGMLVTMKRGLRPSGPPVDRDSPVYGRGSGGVLRFRVEGTPQIPMTGGMDAGKLFSVL